MNADGPKIVTVLLPEDEYTHEPDPVPNYNESMYLNGFDLEREVGAWFRLGNRVNEGYAEMSVCLYVFRVVKDTFFAKTQNKCLL